MKSRKKILPILVEGFESTSGEYVGRFQIKGKDLVHTLILVNLLTINSFKYKTTVLNFIIFYSIKKIMKARLVSGVSSPIVSCQ